MSKFWRAKEFRDLKKEWYNLLKLHGFIDHDAPFSPIIADTRSLKRSSLDFIVKYDQITADYYSQCRAWANHGVFESPMHQRVFELYAEGMPLRQMARQVTDEFQPRKPINIWWLSTRINLMKQEMFTASQEALKLEASDDE